MKTREPNGGYTHVRASEALVIEPAKSWQRLQRAKEFFFADLVRQQQQRKRRTAGDVGDHWENWKHTFPGGYEERSGDAQIGHYHSESHGPSGSNTTDTDWWRRGPSQ